MSIIYIEDLSTKNCKDVGSYFYKNQKYRRQEKQKIYIFQLFHFRNPNVSCMGFLRKCSMFRRRIPLRKSLVYYEKLGYVH